MLTLRELQERFLRSMTADTAQELLALIAGDDFDSASRLAVYKNNVQSRLTDALRMAYPIVCELVDRRFFDYAADSFIRSDPPVGGCLEEYGENFAKFLADFPPAAGVGYLPDVAKLEWLVHKLQAAEQPATVSIEVLSRETADPSRLKFRLTPAVQFIASRHAIDQIWIAHQNESSWESLQLESSPVHLQVSALDHLSILRLPASTWTFRTRIADGEDLGTAAGEAIALSPDFDLASALAALFADGLVVGVMSGRTSSPTPIVRFVHLGSSSTEGGDYH